MSPRHSSQRSALASANKAEAGSDKLSEPGRPGRQAALRMCTIAEGLTTLGWACVGLFKGLRRGVLSPLLCFIFVPLCVVLPVAPVWYANCLTIEGRQRDSQPDVRERMELQGRIATALLLSILWWIILYGLMQLLSSQIDAAAAIYAQQVEGNQQLQIGTPQQLEFSQAVLRSAMAYGFIALLSMALIFALMQNAVSYPEAGLGQGLRGWLLNLPLTLLMVGLLMVCEFFIEREFAHYKLIALEKLMLGQQYFDPGLLFIIIRLYVAHVFCSAMLVSTLKVFRAIP